MNILVFIFIFFSATASAQNTTCPTRPTSDDSNACASTAFVKNSIPEIYVTNYPGVDPTGATDSSAGIQNAISTGNRKVKFPCGTYLIESVVNLPSNVAIEGQGDCTIIKMSATISPNANQVPGVNGVRSSFTNADYTSGNSGISIHDLTIDATAVPNLNQPVNFYKGSNLKVNRVTFLGSLYVSTTLLGAINSFDFDYSHNRFIYTNNAQTGSEGACIAAWDGPHDFIITDNDCDGGSIVGYGIQINGLSSILAFNTAYNGVIANNLVRNTRTFGIDVSGLWNGSVVTPVFGKVKNISIIGNNVVNVVGNNCFRIAEGDNISVVGNLARDCNWSGYSIASANAGVTTNVTLSDNIAENVNMALGAFDAVNIGNGGNIDTLSGISISNMRIAGTNHRYGINIHGGATRTFLNGASIDQGTSGTIIDTGIDTQKALVAESFISSTASSLPAFKLQNNAVDVSGPQIALQKTRNGGATSVNDVLGTYSVLGHDGTALQTGGSFRCVVQSVGSGSVPCAWAFRAGADDVFELFPAAVISLKKHSFIASIAGSASINIPHGVAPASPVNGDIWTTSAEGLLTRINGATKTYADLESAQTFTGAKIANDITVVSFKAVNLVGSTTSPAISSGFCTSPTVSQANGTFAFHVNVGTGCATDTGVISLPTATNGWICDAQDTTSPGTIVVAMVAHTVSTVTFTAYSRTAGTPLNFIDGDTLHIKCVGY